MFQDLPLFPPQASEAAASVDGLYFFLVGVSLLMASLIASLLVLFAVRYRCGSRASRKDAPTGSLGLELVWTLIPFGVVMVVFAWGASVYFHLSRPPDDTMDLLVVGKRWMWKIQHGTGRREINELHVPAGRAVKMTMTSEDVIHSFYVPAFRVKSDVLPGRYTTVWFRPTRPGRYHLFCAEYCGTKHSAMIGWVTVMEPSRFQAWLGGETAGITPAAAGERLFGELGCATCHSDQSGARGPSLRGLYGSRVSFVGGGQVEADEDYLRQSILEPRARIVEGYEPLMPTFRGLVGEEGLLMLIEYIKSLPPPEAGAAVPAAGPVAEKGP
jgi:cytochrome c oxidase subunit 2